MKNDSSNANEKEESVSTTEDDTSDTNEGTSEKEEQASCETQLQLVIWVSIGERILMYFYVHFGSVLRFFLQIPYPKGVFCKKSNNLLLGS